MKIKNSIKILILSILGATFLNGEDKNIVSNIDMSISIKKSLIEDIINKEIPNTLSDSGTGEQLLGGQQNILSLGLNLLGNKDKRYTERLKWSYSISRNPISFSAEGQNFQAITNFNGVLKANYEKASQAVEANLNGVAGIKTNLIIDQNWNLIPKSSPIFTISNKNLPVNLNIYGLEVKTNLDIGNNIQTKVMNSLEKATGEIDQKIKSFNLREVIEKQWEKLKDPILLNSDYNFWLTADPVSAKYSGIVSTSEDIGIKIGSDMYLHGYIGEKPQSLNLGTLPVINYGEVQNGFNIHLPITATYSSLNELLMKNFPGKQFEVFPGIAIKVDTLTATQENRKISLISKMNFSIFSIINPQVIIKASFNPVYDSEQNIFMGEAFDYKIESGSFLIKFIDSIFHSMIQKSIEKNYMKIDLQKDLTSLKKIAQEKVKKIEIDKNTTMFTDINSLKIEKIVVDEQGISLLINILGETNIEINEK